jgi:hypothetical protein
MSKATANVNLPNGRPLPTLKRFLLDVGVSIVIGLTARFAVKGLLRMIRNVDIPAHPHSEQILKDAEEGVQLAVTAVGVGSDIAYYATHVTI